MNIVYVHYIINVNCTIQFNCHNSFSGRDQPPYEEPLKILLKDGTTSTLERPSSYIKSQHISLRKKDDYIKYLKWEIESMKGQSQNRGRGRRSEYKNERYTEQDRDTQKWQRTSSISHSSYDNRNRDRNHYYNRPEEYKSSYYNNREYNTSRPSTSTSASYNARYTNDTYHANNASDTHHANKYNQEKSDKRTTKDQTTKYTEKKERKITPITYNSPKQPSLEKHQTSKDLEYKNQQDSKNSKRKTNEPKSDPQEAPKRQKATKQETHTKHDENNVQPQPVLANLQKVKDKTEQNLNPGAGTLECYITPQDILDYEPEDREYHWYKGQEDKEYRWSDETEIESEPQGKTESSKAKPEPQGEIESKRTESNEIDYKQKYLDLQREVKILGLDLQQEVKTLRNNFMVKTETEFRKGAEEMKEIWSCSCQKGSCCTESQQEVNTMKDILSVSETELKKTKKKVTKLKLEKEKMDEKIEELQKRVNTLEHINRKLTDHRQRGDQILKQFIDQVDSSKDIQKYTPEDSQYCSGYCQQVIKNLEESIKASASEDYVAKQQDLQSALTDLQTVLKNSQNLKGDDKAKLDKCNKYLGKLLHKISEAQTYWITSLSNRNDSPQQAYNIFNAIRAAYLEGIKQEFTGRLDYLQRYIENKENPTEKDDRLQNRILTIMDEISTKTDIYCKQSINIFFWALTRKHCQITNLKHIIYTQRCKYLCKQFPELQEQIISDTKHYIEDDVLYVPKIFEEVNISSLDEFIKSNYIDVTRTLPKIPMTKADVELDSTCQSLPPICNIKDIQDGPKPDLVLYTEEAAQMEFKNAEE